MRLNSRRYVIPLLVCQSEQQEQQKVDKFGFGSKHRKNREFGSCWDFGSGTIV